MKFAGTLRLECPRVGVSKKSEDCFDKRMLGIAAFCVDARF